jgi:hypothetical protein
VRSDAARAPRRTETSANGSIGSWVRRAVACAVFARPESAVVQVAGSGQRTATTGVAPSCAQPSCAHTHTVHRHTHTPRPHGKRVLPQRRSGEREPWRRYRHGTRFKNHFTLVNAPSYSQHNQCFGRHSNKIACRADDGRMLSSPLHSHRLCLWLWMLRNCPDFSRTPVLASRPPTLPAPYDVFGSSQLW